MAAKLPSGVALHDTYTGADADAWREQLEEALAWLPEVEDAAVLALRECLHVAVLAPNADEMLLRTRVAELLARRTQPGKVRVCRAAARALKRGGGGRHDRARLLRFFDLGRDGEPLAFALEARGETDPYTYPLYVPANYAYFEGHFPGYPILPGAAQLSEMVLPCVRRARPGLGRLVRMARVKFQERIKPDELIDVSLTFGQEPTQVDFTLRRGATVCAAGRLVFAPLTPAGAV
jgi:hypothetical protein